MLVGENQQSFIKFDQGKSYCAFIDKSQDSKNQLFSIYFDVRKGSNIIKRRPSRFVFVSLSGEMKKGQGDHIFPFSTINLIIASLFAELTLTEFTKKIHVIFHPWIRVLYKFNQEFLEKNEESLKNRVDFSSFYKYFNSFGEQFLDVQLFYDDLIDGECDIEAINDYLNMACIFYHNLPLTVFGNGPAGKNNGTAYWNKRFKEGVLHNCL